MFKSLALCARIVWALILAFLAVNTLDKMLNLLCLSCIIYKIKTITFTSLWGNTYLIASLRG